MSFGFPMMLTSLINAVYNNLYTLVIGKKFDKKQLGLFNRAATFAGYVPTNLSDFSQRALFPFSLEIRTISLCSDSRQSGRCT